MWFPPPSPPDPPGILPERLRGARETIPGTGRRRSRPPSYLPGTVPRIDGVMGAYLRPTAGTVLLLPSTF